MASGVLGTEKGGPRRTNHSASYVYGSCWGRGVELASSPTVALGVPLPLSSSKDLAKLLSLGAPDFLRLKCQQKTSHFSLLMKLSQEEIRDNLALRPGLLLGLHRAICGQCGGGRSLLHGPVSALSRPVSMARATGQGGQAAVCIHSRALA